MQKHVFFIASGKHATELNPDFFYFYFLFNVNLTQGLKTPGVLFLTPGTIGSMDYVVTLGLCPSP